LDRKIDFGRPPSLQHTRALSNNGLSARDGPSGTRPKKFSRVLLENSCFHAPVGLGALRFASRLRRIGTSAGRSCTEKSICRCRGITAVTNIGRLPGDKRRTHSRPLPLLVAMKCD
jgi:hypothetical protein